MVTKKPAARKTAVPAMKARNAKKPGSVNRGSSQKARSVNQRSKAGTSKQAASDRKQHFVEAYIANGGNGRQAAITAGFSARTATQQASRLLTDVNVQAQIRERRSQLLQKLELNTEGVLRNLAQAVYFDPRKLFKADGTALLPHELDDDTAAALSGVEFEVGANGKVVSAKYKAAEKNGARDQAMKHLGLFKADNTQRTLLGDVPRDKLKAIVARLAGG